MQHTGKHYKKLIFAKKIMMAQSSNTKHFMSYLEYVTHSLKQQCLLLPLTKFWIVTHYIQKNLINH